MILCTSAVFLGLLRCPKTARLPGKAMAFRAVAGR